MTNVIPFRRKPEPEQPGHFKYLAALMTVIEGLAYPSIVMLFSGALLHIWQAKNGGDRKATLDDLNEFARGLRWEVKKWQTVR